MKQDLDEVTPNSSLAQRPVAGRRVPIATAACSFDEG